MLYYEMLRRIAITSSILVYSVMPIDSLQQRVRDYILVKQKNTCGKCNCKFSDEVPHEIHHLNHNSSDNNVNNLLALCCNCHSAHHRYNKQVMPFLPSVEYLSIINNEEPYYKSIKSVNKSIR
mgnify:FL=1|tara:strand:- start:93 stop:461 length:369 start_codon:yes stop_codon:yes gene_type:complete